MTPDLAKRVDAWISDNIALLEPEAGLRQAMAFNLRWGWIEARGTWMGLVATGQTEAECRVAAAAMRGILLELVRWAWGIPGLSVTSHPSAVVELWRILAHGEVLRIGGLVGFTGEDEALVTALEAAPRQPQIGGAS